MYVSTKALLISILCAHASAFMSLHTFTMPKELTIRTKPNICNVAAKSDGKNLNDPWEYGRFIRINKLPIPLMTFDDIFLNINGVDRVILTTNCDRIIVIYNGKRGVYYMDARDQEHLSRVRFLLSQINAEITIEHPFNMDNPNHQYYCEPKPEPSENMTEKEYEDYIDNFSGNNMDNPASNFSPENLLGYDPDEGDEFDNDYGYGFGIE